MTGIAPTVAPAQNLFKDPYFRYGIGGFVASSASRTCTQDATRAHSDTDSLKITNISSPLVETSAATQIVNDTAGLSFLSASCWVWVPTGSTGASVGRLRISGIGVITTSSPVTPLRDQWVYLTVTAPCQPAGGAGSITLFPPLVSGGSVWYDDIGYVVSNTPLPAFSGDDPGCHWVGAPGNSASDRLSQPWQQWDGSKLVSLNPAGVWDGTTTQSKTFTDVTVG